MPVIFHFQNIDIVTHISTDCLPVFNHGLMAYYFKYNIVNTSTLLLDKVYMWNLLFTFKSWANFKFSSRTPFLRANSFKAEVIASFCFSSIAYHSKQHYLICMYVYICICILRDYCSRETTILNSETFLSSVYFSFWSCNSWYDTD